MALDRAQIVKLFKDIYLFAALDDSQLARIADMFVEQELTAGERLFSQGDHGDDFFVIFEGELQVTTKRKGVVTSQGVLVAGDFFGEEALLYNQPRSASITAIVNSRLLKLERARFRRLINEYPQIRSGLELVVDSHRYARTYPFRWVAKDEVVYAIRRKHVFYLLIVLALPTLVLLLGMLPLILAVINIQNNAVVSTVLFVIAGIFLVVGGGWGAWNWIDWGNDYYVVTNRRVVWIEEVIWLYESQTEAPLNTLLSVNVTSSYWGRVFGYGDVIVRTFTGEVKLRVVEDPKQLASLIEQYWNRTKRSMQRSGESEVELAIRRVVLGEIPPAPPSPAPTPSDNTGKSPDVSGYKEPSLWQTYFGNVFKMRFEDGKIITYRTHWIILFRRNWLATLLTFTLLVSVITYDVLFILDKFRVASPWVVTGLGFILFVLALLPWWLYNYVDWRNDIYQVTDKNIFDISRKPFGTEVRKSASLENILSLENERPGFLGYVFNFGTVTINVGDSKFLFKWVHQPALTQQEIFTRMYAVRVQKEKSELSQEEERIIKLLATYHKVVEGSKPKE